MASATNSLTEFTGSGRFTTKQFGHGHHIADSRKVLDYVVRQFFLEDAEYVNGH
ncbi:MAG: hypothetical protein Q7N50_10245 [Armatimonadota bacterium]|nr:hypothetical protein [Armatimonadota bacterium]